MVEFKKKADAIIKEQYGIEVEHVCAMQNGEKLTYEKLFYHTPKHKPEFIEKHRRERERESKPDFCGFPLTRGAWCHKLKYGSYIRIPNDPRQLVY